MKIISKFQDYYDSALAYGMDKELIYNRKTIRTEYHKTNNPSPAHIKPLFQILNKVPTPAHLYGRNTNMASVDGFVYGFCGKVYVGLKLKYIENPHNYHIQEEHEAFCFSVDDIIKFLEKFPALKNDLKLFLEKPEPRKELYWRKNSFNQYDVETFFEEYTGNTKYENAFYESKVPAMVVYKGSNYQAPSVLELNPCLKDYGFMRMIDPFTAFQEISMYISGVLGVGNPEMVEISDESMRDKKGFNDKSFKKAPTKKR